MLNLLRLNSKCGKFTIKDLKCNSLENETTDHPTDSIAPFDNVLHYFHEYEIVPHDMDVMVFIAGYVSYSVAGKLKCVLCTNRLSTSKNLNIDETSNSNYLSLLNRGGLKWPTSFMLNVCVTVYKIFQCILNEFEDQFVRAHDQRNILLSICLKALYSEDMLELCPDCNASTEKIHIFSIRTMSNIVLNNYTKMYNNFAHELNRNKPKQDRKKKLKLDTLTS